MTFDQVNHRHLNGNNRSLPTEVGRLHSIYVYHPKFLLSSFSSFNPSRPYIHKHGPIIRPRSRQLFFWPINTLSDTTFPPAAAAGGSVSPSSADPTRGCTPARSYPVAHAHAESEEQISLGVVPMYVDGTWGLHSSPTSC